MEKNGFLVESTLRMGCGSSELLRMQSRMLENSHGKGFLAENNGLLVKNNGVLVENTFRMRCKSSELLGM